MLYKKTFTLTVTPPFNLSLTVWTLRRRQKNLIDLWDGNEYSRVFSIQNIILQVVVTHKTKRELQVVLKSNSRLDAVQPIITKILQQMLGANRNLDNFYQLAKKDTYIIRLMETFKGVKPPRFPTIFESLINAISCQQVTLDLGILLLNRLAEKYGKKFESKNGIQYAFPNPEDLYGISEEELKKLGYSYQKARAIKELSQAIVEKKVLFIDMEELSNEEIITYLTKIRGIGRWSAEYVLLRGLGRIDVFPADDVGAQNSLMQLMNLDKRPNYDEIKKLTKKWKPYAGLVYFHLLLNKLQKNVMLT